MIKCQEGVWFIVIVFHTMVWRATLCCGGRKLRQSCHNFATKNDTEQQENDAREKLWLTKVG